MEIGIREDMGTMEHRVRELRGDVGMLRERVAGLDQRVVHLDQRLSRLEIRFDEEFPPGAASGV